MASTILGPDGRPISTRELTEPQTSRLAHLQRELQQHPARGLTPSRLAQILDAAEQGDLIAQSELFEDMEEKDPHIASEMGKRRRAVLVEWELVPPPNPSAKERADTEQLAELVAAVPDFEDVIFDVTDAIGKGYACLEIEWHRLGRLWLPKTITHRPQSWFLLQRAYRQELRLRSNTSVDGVPGEPLAPLGWITHVHKAKSGYLERASLFRQLAWPYLFKNYSVGDLAEFLEIYGIPLRLGKYPPGASEKEKATLLRALVGVGHNAAGIIPEGMMLEFHEAATGDPKAFELMLNWCERSQSKVILGGTLTSQADGKSSTNALGNVHNEVRKDLRDSDLRQVNATLSRDLVFAIATVNGLAPNGIARTPQMHLQADEPEDLTAYADALPKLVSIGVQVPVQWAQERLGIPQPQEGEAVLVAQPTSATHAAPAVASASAQRPPPASAPAPAPAPTVPQAMLPRLARDVQPGLESWIDRIRTLAEGAQSLEEIRDGLEALLPDMTLEQYAEAMAQALAAAALAGRYEVLQEAAGGRG